MNIFQKRSFFSSKTNSTNGNTGTVNFRTEDGPFPKYTYMFIHFRLFQIFKVSDPTILSCISGLLGDFEMQINMCIKHVHSTPLTAATDILFHLLSFDMTRLSRIEVLYFQRNSSRRLLHSYNFAIKLARPFECMDESWLKSAKYICLR